MDGSPTRNKLTNASAMRSSSQGKLQGHKKLPPLEGKSGDCISTHRHQT